MDRSVSRQTASSSCSCAEIIRKTVSSALIIANVDGTNERELSVKNFPDRFSPIFFTGHRGRLTGRSSRRRLRPPAAGSKVVGVFRRRRQGTELIATDRGLLPRGCSGCLICPDCWSSRERTRRRATVAHQLSRRHDPAHHKRPGAYRAIGLTQDGKKITTVQAQGLVNLWICPTAMQRRRPDCRPGTSVFIRLPETTSRGRRTAESCLFRTKAAMPTSGSPNLTAANANN